MNPGKHALPVEHTSLILCVDRSRSSQENIKTESCTAAHSRKHDSASKVPSDPIPKKFAIYDGAVPDMAGVLDLSYLPDQTIELIFAFIKTSAIPEL